MYCRWSKTKSFPSKVGPRRPQSCGPSTFLHQGPHPWLSDDRTACRRLQTACSGEYNRIEGPQILFSCGAGGGGAEASCRVVAEQKVLVQCVAATRL